MKILALDPGKTTGWATIFLDDKKITLGILGETKDMTLSEIEDHFKDSDLIVYEGFWLRKDIAEGGRWNWNEGEVMQVIGVIKSLGARYQKPLEKVQSGQRIPGYAWVGMKFDPAKRGKGVHQKDALGHAVSYAVRKLGAHPVFGHSLES